jgi:serine protease Do
MLKTLARCSLVFLATLVTGAHAASPHETVQRVKGSVVAIGTYLPTRAPQHMIRGTGFVAGDGTLVVTNGHVLLPRADESKMETYVVTLPGEKQRRPAVRVAYAPEHDLAVLRIQGPPLPSLTIKDSDSVREGDLFYFTGFPIGEVLGLFPATHRAMVSAITPIAIPAIGAQQLDAKTIRRLSIGAIPVFQLDGTAYPGNSGSPLYDPETGEVVAIINMVFVKGSKEFAITNPSGIGYAIPAKHIRELLRDLK